MVTLDSRRRREMVLPGSAEARRQCVLPSGPPAVDRAVLTMPQVDGSTNSPQAIPQHLAGETLTCIRAARLSLRARLIVSRQQFLQRQPE